MVTEEFISTFRNIFESMTPFNVKGLLVLSSTLRINCSQHKGVIKVADVES